MEVGLGDAGEPGKTAFRRFTTPHAEAEVFNKPSPQIVKGHRQAISQRNRSVLVSLVPDLLQSKIHINFPAAVFGKALIEKDTKV